ncbi:hypothetical protein FJZ22_01535 [Candidatus Pacearchaeota archaeon]|nr:hypothetical protein [Candidatus Pacearchaeota archaeon]
MQRGVNKRWFFVCALLLLVVGVVAYNSNPANPAVFGHSIDEIEGLRALIAAGGSGSTSGSSLQFGDYQKNFAYDTVYQAPNDGFVIVYSVQIGQVNLFTGTTATPTDAFPSGDSTYSQSSITMPIKKNMYWKAQRISGAVLPPAKIWYLPIISGGSGSSASSELILDAVDSGPATFPAAFGACRNAGKRLPTDDELIHFSFSGTAQNADSDFLWTTSTDDARDSFVVIQLTHGGQTGASSNTDRSGNRGYAVTSKYRCVSGGSGSGSSACTWKSTGPTAMTGAQVYASGATGLCRHTVSGTTVYGNVDVTASNSAYCYTASYTSPSYTNFEYYSCSAGGGSGSGSSASIPAGTWCGMGYYRQGNAAATAGTFLITACQDVNPATSCPSGYTQLVYSVSYATPSDKTSNAYSNMYTCVKN